LRKAATLTLEQLFPESGRLEAAEAYADLLLAELAPEGRPYVIANMVSTADGQATLAGRTEGISSDADRELFLELRTQVDAVMAGTATIGLEGYGPLIRSAERRNRRRRIGLEEVPLAVSATRTMELPVKAPLFQDRDSRVVVLTNSERGPPAAAAAVTVERIAGPELDLVAAMERLRARHGVRSLLLEGGPTLLAAMIGAGVVNELFLTLAGRLAGSGQEPAILEGAPLAEPADLTLKSVLKDENYLFLRYELRR
jgi:riboflavin biosynthesis pyrimidine reductase